MSTGYRITRSGSIAMPPGPNGSYHSVSILTVRRVWAALSRTPGATVRQIGQRLGLHYSNVAAAIIILVQVGYVEQEHGHTGRVVVVPLLVDPEIRTVRRKEARHAA